ncbi:MAG: phage terminase large subunit [Endomicrobium sp.]|jgi:PBSX family phage terminase large subunit|nr:phage terminase large subunit [Endomicrobium sp.]
MLLTQKQKELRNLCVSGAREILAVGGSRSGKTTLFLRNLIIRSLKVKEARHAIFRQQFIDVKHSIGMQSLPFVLNLFFKGVPYKINKSDWIIKFINNGSEIWLVGLDDKIRTDKVLGLEFSGGFFNEVSEISYKSYLKANTRFSQKNDLCKIAYLDENPTTKGHWSYKKFIQLKDPQDDTPIDPSSVAHIFINPEDNIQNLPKEYLNILDGLSIDEKNRFKFGLFQNMVAGAVYKHEISAAEIEGRIGDIKPDTEHPVYAVFDIGISDATAIWIVQFLKNKILFLDYYENNMEALPHYLAWIENHEYKIKKMFLPHDAENKNWSTGKSSREVAQSYGNIKGFDVEVIAAMPLWDSINAVRILFPKFYFNESKCKEGIEAIRNYKKQWNDVLGIYKQEPLHDWASHCADALRYTALAYNLQNISPFEKAKEQKKGITFNDILSSMKKRKQNWI